MAVTVEDVRVRVTVDGADGYDDLRDKQKDLEDQSKSTGGALDGLKAGLVNVAAAIQIAQAAVGALAAAMATLRVPAQLAIDFEREFALVATLSDQVGADLERGLLELAGRVPQTAGDITKATYQAISAGIDPGQVVDFLDAASKAAVAGNTTLTASVEALTTAVNAFASQGVTAAQASDVLFATVKAGVTTFDELNASLGQASAVAAYGVSLEEVGAAVASLTKLGFSTSDAITRINGAVKAIANPVGAAAAQFKRLGVEVGIDRLQAVGLAGVLADIEKATGGSAAQIAKLTNRFEAQQGLLGLLGSNYEGFEENLQRTGGAAGATSDAFDKLSNTTQGAIDRLQSTAEGTLRELGDAILPAINEAAESLNETLTTEGPAMIKALADIAAGFAAIVGPAGAAAAGAARFFNLISGAREAAAQSELDDRTASLLDARSRAFAFGRGVNPADIARGAGDDRDAQRAALEEFASARAADVEAQRAEIARRFEAAQKAAQENQAVLAFTGGKGPLGRSAAAEAEGLQQRALAVGEEIAAVNKARLLLRDIVDDTFAALDKAPGPRAAGGGDGLDALTGPGAGRRGRAAPDLGGATLLTPLQNAVGDAYGGVLAAAGAYGDFAAAVQAEEDRQREFDALQSQFAEQRLNRTRTDGERELAELDRKYGDQLKQLERFQLDRDEVDAEFARRRLELEQQTLGLTPEAQDAALGALRDQYEARLDIIAAYEAEHGRITAEQAEERAELQRRIARQDRESVARDVAATIGGLADITEALGATGKAQSAFRAVALAADAIYHGIRGGGAQADAITAFAAGNIVQGIAFQAAAIQQFAASAQAASGAAKLAGGGGGGGGSRGGGGGGFATSRRATDDRQTDRPVRGGESQAPGLTIIISDAIPLSDRREVMEPLVRSLADHVRRATNTRAGARWPGAA